MKNSKENFKKLTSKIEEVKTTEEGKIKGGVSSLQSDDPDKQPGPDKNGSLINCNCNCGCTKDSIEEGKELG